MKAVRVSESATVSCRHCRRAIKRGQVALLTDMPNNPITDRIFAVHVSCMKNLVASAPADHDEETFHALRDRIAETRCAFPD